MSLKLGSLFYDIGADTAGLKKAEKEIAKTTKRSEKHFNSLGNAIKAALTFEVARRVLMLADGMVMLRGRVDQLTASQKESNKVFAEIVAISNRVGTAIDGTISSFQRFSLTKEVLQANNDELLQFTETIQKLGIISGATGQEVAQTSIQIGQALSNNFEAAAQEINSINEQMPAVARAVEKSLGLIPGSFKKAVTEGKVSARDFFNAILQQSDAVNTKFEKLPTTIARAWQGLLNNATLVTEELDKQWGLTKRIAELVTRISKSFAEGLKFRKETADREVAISKILEARGVADYLSKDLNDAKQLNAALLKRELLLAKISKAEKAGGANSEFRVANAKKQLEFAEETIDKLGQQGGRAKELLAVWIKLTAAMEKARDAGGKEPLIISISSPAEPKGLSAGQILARLGDEREAVQLAFEQAQTDILASEKIGAESRLELMKIAGEVRLEALREISAREVEIVRAKEEEKAALQTASDQATLGAISQFSSSVTELTTAAGKENSAAAKAAFLAAQGVRVASIIANSQVGASAALALGPSGIPLAGWIEGLGFASAGIVAGLAVNKATGGGRQSGGPVSPGRVHPINENGDPEILVQGARQFLLPGSKGGDVVSGASMRMGGGGTPSVKIINNGAPIEVVGQQISRNEIVLMVKNAENTAVSRVNTSLATGRGETAGALKQGFETQRNL